LISAHRPLASPKLRASIASALTVLFVSFTCAFAQTAVGTISQMTGRPQVTRGSRTLAGAVGTPIDLLDRLTTDGSSTLTVTFDDSS
jgi:hypothetical protein